MLLYVHSSFATIVMGKKKLVALLSLSSWCLVIVVWLFLVVPWVFFCSLRLWYFLIILTYYFCGYLLGKGLSLDSLVCDAFLCFCHFPILCLGSSVELDCIDS